MDRKTIPTGRPIAKRNVPFIFSVVPSGFFEFLSLVFSFPFSLFFFFFFFLFFFSSSLSLDDSSLDDDEDEEDEDEESTSCFWAMMSFGAFFRCSRSSSVSPPKPIDVKKLIANLKGQYHTLKKDTNPRYPLPNNLSD